MVSYMVRYVISYIISARAVFARPGMVASLPLLTFYLLLYSILSLYILLYTVPCTLYTIKWTHTVLGIL